MTIETIIRGKLVETMAALTSTPVIEFGTSADEKTGAQYVVQCDRPAPAEDGRTRTGRVLELTYTLIIHAIVHSQKQRESPGGADTMVDLADTVIAGLDADTITGWLDGAGKCTGVIEQEGQYNFSEAFDDFATVAEIYIIQTQEN